MTSKHFTLRATELVSQMTLDEKISQMVYPAAAIERLGVPKYNWWNEALHGVGRAGLATVFPQAIGMAASWNEGLVHEVATAISDEARAKHRLAVEKDLREMYVGLTFWSPNINIFRDPRWGRGQETYGEDPYLTAVLGVAFIRGLQGDHPEYLKLVATPKHFAVHSGPESTRHSANVEVSERDLREFYLFAFEACIKEGRAASVMGAYNRVNGEPCCSSQTLLDQILREEWGFSGYVVSDCEAIRDIWEHHQVVDTPAEAAALAVRQGCDLDCGSEYPTLAEAVDRGLITEEEIDQSVVRLFSARFNLGMFDPPQEVPFTEIPIDVLSSERHRTLALRAARESIVLLQNNEDLLPLNRDLKSIAVIGPNANDERVLLGNYSGTPSTTVTPLRGIREKLGDDCQVLYEPGVPLTEGVPLLEPIPTKHLIPMGGGQGQYGVRGSYFDNAERQGKPVRVQIDPQVDFIWKDSSPLSGEWGERFSAHWEGYLEPPISGSYTIGVNGAYEYKFILDGEPFVEATFIHHPILQTRQVDLEAGRRYAIELEYANLALDPQVQLLWSMPDEERVSRAIEIAKGADAVVMVMGLSPSLEGEEMEVDLEGFSGGDRTDIRLPASQRRLLQEIRELEVPIVLVLMNGSALALNWASENVQAIVEAWYPGELGGEAIADILFGDYTPGGKLPVTFYCSIDDLPPFDDYALEGRTYRYFDGEVLYPFGHGLSYTTFELHGLELDQGSLSTGESLAIRVKVSNRGDRSGDEVVQLYTSRASSRSKKELKGFKRVTLEPGETRSATFTLHADQLVEYDEQAQAVLRQGEVEVLVGNSSENTPLRARFEIAPNSLPGELNKVFRSTVSMD